LYINFQTNKTGLSKILAAKKSYSLVEADEQLKVFARNLPVTKKPNLVTIEIHDEDEMILKSEFVAGTDESSNLLLLVIYLLKTEFPDVDESERADLLQRINLAYKKELEPSKKDHDTSSEKKTERELNTKKESKVSIAEEKPSILVEEPSAINKVVDPKKNDRPRKNLKLPQLKTIRKKPANKAHGLKKQKKLLILAGILLLISGIGIGILSTQSVGSDQIESYSKLVDQGKYSKALTEYPKQEFRLIETLYSQKKSDQLKKLADTNHSNLALFYWAFLNEKWSRVTGIKGISQNTTIQAMRGFAFVKQGKLEEAEIINQVLENETLQDQINQARKEEAYENLRNKDIKSAEVINNKIHDDGLAEDIKVAKSIVNLLKKYESDKENPKLSEAERAEAQNNYDLWAGNLEQLGGKVDGGE